MDFSDVKKRSYLFKLDYKTSTEEKQRVREDVEDLNRLLSKFGIKAEYNSMQQLFIYADQDLINKATNRNAGRKKDRTLPFSYNINPKIKDVFQMQQTMTNAEIIEKIGCSRATFYRALKSAKERVDRLPSYVEDFFFL